MTLFPHIIPHTHLYYNTHKYFIIKYLAVISLI